MANEIDDAIKAAEKELPSNLTWGQAVKSHADAVLPLWQMSGRVAANDELTTADRHRLADAIVKQQTSAKEKIIMTTDEAAAAMFADADQRQLLLAAAKHRAKLQRSDTESIFDIAARLRTQVEAARAADAAQRRPAEAIFDASGHRPGWRLDARRKNRPEEGEEEEENE
jgi:hypothetical protein